MFDLKTNTELRVVVGTLLQMGENSVRPANQNAPINDGEEYVTVQLTGEHAEGTDDTRWLGVSGDNLFGAEEISGTRLVNATIQYFNGDAFGRLRLLSQRLQSLVGTGLLEEFGFGFSVVSSVQDLTGLLPDSIWQTRAVMRFNFYIAVDDLIRIPLIVTVPMTTIPERGEQSYSEVKL